MENITINAAASCGLQTISHVQMSKQKALWIEMQKQARRAVGVARSKGRIGGGYDADDLAQDCYLQLHQTLRTNGDSWFLCGKSGDSADAQPVANLPGYLAWLAAMRLRDAERRQRAEDQRNSAYQLCEARSGAPDVDLQIDARRLALTLLCKGDQKRQIAALTGVMSPAAASDRKFLQRFREKISAAEL